MAEGVLFNSYIVKDVQDDSFIMKELDFLTPIVKSAVEDSYITKVYTVFSKIDLEDG